MAEFKSSAKKIAFNPITLPDTATDYLRAEERRIAKLKEVYDTDINNRNQYADALKQKQEAEARNVESNSKLKEQFDATYAQQLKERYRQLIKKDVDKNKAYEQRLENLATFSKAAGDELKAFGKRRAENQQNIGFNLYGEVGVDPIRMKEWELQVAELEAEGIAEEEYKSTLESRGVDAAKLRRVEGLSGWRLVGYQQAMAQAAGARWQAFTQNPERRAKKYQLQDGTEMSLQDLEDHPEPPPGAFSDIIKQMQFEFTPAYSDLSPEMAAKYFWPNVRKVTEALQGNFSAKDQEKYRASRDEDDANMLYSSFDSDGNVDMTNILNHLGGPKIGIDRMYQGAIKLAQIGRFSIDHLDKLKDGRLLKDGKETSFYEAFKNSTKHQAHWVQIEQAINKFNSVEEQAKREQKRIKKEEDLDLLTAQVSSTGLSPTQLNEAEKIFFREHGELLPDHLKTYATNETYGINDAEAIIEEQWREGTLTMDELKKKAYSVLGPDKLKYWEKFTNDGNGVDPKLIAAYEKSLEEDIRDSLNLTSYDVPSKDFAPVAYFAKQHFKSKVQELLDADVHGSANQAVKAAFQEVRQDIEKGRSDNPEGSRYKTNRLDDGKTPDTQNPGFVRMRGVTRGHPATEKLHQTFTQLYAADNDVVENKQLFGDINDKQSLIYRVHTDYRNGGTIPKVIKDIAVRDLDRNHIDIMNAQLNQYPGLDPIPTSRDEQAQYASADQFKRLITHMQSEGRVSRALVDTNSLNGIVGVPAFKPILDLIASEESANDTVHNGYDSMNEGGYAQGHKSIFPGTGTKKFGKPLIEMTLQEVMDHQANGDLFASGRYQIIPETLAGLVNNLGLDPQKQIYDEVTQDLLAIHLLWGRVGKQLSTDGKALIGLGQEWIGVQKVPFDVRARKIEETKNNPRYKNFDLMRMYPQFVGQ